MKLPPRPPAKLSDIDLLEVLTELIDARRYDEFIQTNNQKYPYWDKWKYLAQEWSYPADRLWTAAKQLRIGNMLFFNYLPRFTINAPAIVQQYLHELDMNLGGSLQAGGIIPAEEKDRYLLSSLMEEAIASSQLEGAATTRKVAREMLQNSRKPKNHSEQMILNNFEGMKWIVANKDLPITAANIKIVHRLITRSTLSDDTEEGQFRTDDHVNVVDVQTGEIVYRPPAYTELPNLIGEYCDFANDAIREPFFIHPIAKAIMLHFLMGFIHPFADGNGRTARTIFYWYLLKKGYWLTEYMSVSRIILSSRAQYARAYLHTELDANDLTYFLIYNLKCMSLALADLKKYIALKTAEKKELVSLLRNTAFNQRQMSVVQEALHDPYVFFTVQKLQSWFTISDQTARNDLNELVSAGLLEHRLTGKKMMYYPVTDFASRVKKA